MTDYDRKLEEALMRQARSDLADTFLSVLRLIGGNGDASYVVEGLRRFFNLIEEHQQHGIPVNLYRMVEEARQFAKEDCGVLSCKWDEDLSGEDAIALEAFEYVCRDTNQSGFGKARSREAYRRYRDILEAYGEHGRELLEERFAEVIRAQREEYEATRQMEMNRPHFVYFIGPDTVLQGEDSVKIGMSVNPETRLNSLQTSSPVPLSILARVECSCREDAIAKEREFHDLLSEYRMSGEWFAPVAPVLEQIEKHK